MIGSAGSAVQLTALLAYTGPGEGYLMRWLGRPAVVVVALLVLVAIVALVLFLRDRGD